MNVYFLADASKTYIKIGHSRCVEARLNAFGSIASCCFAVKCETTKEAISLEKYLHEALIHHKATTNYVHLNEWFHAECYEDLLKALDKSPHVFEPAREIRLADNYVNMSFKVTRNFKQRLKLSAIERGVTMTEALIEALERFEGKHGIA